MKNRQALNDDNSIDQNGFSKTSRLELFDEEELKFFSNTKSITNSIADMADADADADAKNNRVEVIDSPELTHIAPMIHVDDNRDEVNFYDSEPLKPFNTYLNQYNNDHTAVNLVNNIKLLTTGLMCGLLLSVVAVIVLNKLGVLATLMPSESTILMVETQNQDLAASTNSQTNTQDTLKLSAAPVAAQPIIGTAQQPSSNSAISPKDFQREAQSTLYRETND